LGSEAAFTTLDIRTLIRKILANSTYAISLMVNNIIKINKRINKKQK
jgi:hypothetical protein